MHVVNIAAYKFIDLPATALVELRDQLRAKAAADELKGTILLSAEGINLTLAGLASAIDNFQQHLAGLAPFADLSYKQSISSFVPFKRLLVKIKKEIITSALPQTKPSQFTAPAIAPEQFKQWCDEAREMLILDTRNDYEIAHGKFEQAVDLGLTSFVEFAQAVEKLPPSAKAKPIVTYCTGGIRCEKAAAYLLQQGFSEVYQLQGGILNYFERCQNAYFAGDCFVFDERTALNGNLQITSSVPSAHE